MKVAMVTSWPPRWCGIAIYAENLVDALRAAGADVHIVCHKDGGRDGEKQVYPVLDQWDPGWYWDLFKTVEAIDPDVVHIQHEFGLYTYFQRAGVYDFEPRNAFELALPLFRWRIARRPAVITYHSVFSQLTYEEARYYDQMIGLAAASIVHEPYQKAHLPGNIGRVPDNVFVIPHGAGRSSSAPGGRRASKERLGIEAGRPAAGVMGWWEPNKGFDRVIRVWPRVVERVPGATLLFSGGARPGSPTGEATRAEYLGLIERSPVKGSIKVIEGAFSREEYISIMSAFDFAILPYLYASQSGNLAHAYEAGLPIVASGIEGLKSSLEASGAGLLVPAGDDAAADEALVEAIVRLFNDAGLRRRLARRSREYVRNVIKWDRVAKRHLDVYRWARKRLVDPSNYIPFLEQRVHV